MRTNAAQVANRCQHIALVSCGQIFLCSPNGNKITLELNRYLCDICICHYRGFDILCLCLGIFGVSVIVRAICGCVITGILLFLSCWKYFGICAIVWKTYECTIIGNLVVSRLFQIVWNMCRCSGNIWRCASIRNFCFLSLSGLSQDMCRYRDFLCFLPLSGIFLSVRHHLGSK